MTKPVTIPDIASGRDTQTLILGLEDKTGIAKEIKVSRRTIDNYMLRRVIPFIRIGRVVRFDVARVKAALRRFEVRPAGDHNVVGE